MLAYPTIRAVYHEGTLKPLEPLMLPEGSEVELILLESVRVPSPNVESPPVVSVPASAFRRLIGLVSTGGDALSESEALYEDESRDRRFR